MGSWTAAVGQPVGPVDLAVFAANFRGYRPMKKVKALALVLKVDLKNCLNLNLIQIQTPLN
jgi:hypothetical protein